MSLQTPSKEKLVKTSVASFVESHPEASMHNIAVLFTDVVGSTKYFKKHGDIKGREMLRRHHRIAISIVEEFGGSLIKEVGDSVMVYFPDGLNALKAGIKMQHQFSSHNKSAESHNQIHIRVGIHYGKVIVEEKDIYGDVVNVASKLTNLANGDQLFVSHVIYEMTKNTSGAKYELINFWNLKNVPIGLTIYKVIWEDSPVTEAEKMAIVQFRVKDNAASEGFNYFNRIWQAFIARKDSFLAATHDSEYLSPEGTLVVSYKDSNMALNFAERVFEYLTEEMKKAGSNEKPPVHAVITKDTHPKGNLLPIQKSRIDVQAFGTGDIHLSKSIFDDVRKQRDMSTTPPPFEYHGKAFYKHVKGAPFVQSSTASGGQNPSPGLGSFPTCFYCGSRHHSVKDCPTKNFTEATHALSEAGYVSDDRLRGFLAIYNNGTAEGFQNAAAVLRTNAYNEQELTANSLYEIKNVYQLRFFKTIWESGADSWDKAKKNISVSEGGFSWLVSVLFRKGTTHLVKFES
ncbi:MAG TPA: adenylate/guanylate cyclase domain-containing protein [Syntrophorhabdaceae bacterium]|nr:adenylate/guanylate cyclase domain-containing protein [Syntrophorhabdaceae bacterium]